MKFLTFESSSKKPICEIMENKKFKKSKTIFLDSDNECNYTFNNFNKVINYTFFNVKYEIPKIRVFNQLKETINNVEWIMNTVVAQQDVFVK